MANHLEVTLEFIVHATEDSKKILKPINELFGIKEEEFIHDRLAGHFGNPILLMKAKLQKKRAEEFIKKLISKISKQQLNSFLNEIEMYFEGSSLFLRVSKMDLINKSINLKQNDALKIRISTPVYKKDDFVKTYLQLLTQ